MQPRSLDSRRPRTDKKAVSTGGGKKKSQLVASTAAKQKKPVIVRRQSTKSSTGIATKIDTRNTNQSSAKRMLPTFSEAPHSKEKAPRRLQRNFSSDHLATQSSRKWRSSKSADSVSVRKLTRKESSEGRSGESAAEAAALGELGEPGPSTRLHSVETQQTIKEDLAQEERDLELQRMPFEEADACVKNRNSTSSQHTSNEDLRVPQKSIPSIPEGSQEQDIGAIHMLADDTMSIATVAPTLADSIGQLDLGDTTSAVLPQATGAEGRDNEDVKQIAAFVKIPVPTISARIPKDSLESKSQLTLLLENDRAKCGT